MVTADIYVITCATNSKVYVGSAKQSRIRLKDHWVTLKAGKHVNSYLQRAWNKHGAESFSHKIVESCPLDQRWVREQWWINELRACDKSYGFNSMHSVQELLPSPVMSKKLTRYWKIRWQDPEYKEKRTEELRGLSKKPGVRAKMQASKLASWQDPEYRALQTKKHQEWAAKNKATLRANAKKLWDDPAYRAKQLAERKARFKDPVFRAKLSAAALKRPSKRFPPVAHNEIV